VVVPNCNLNPLSLVHNWNPDPLLGVPRRRIPRNERHPMGNNRLLPQHNRTHPIPHRQRKPTRRSLRQTHNKSMPTMRPSPRRDSKVLSQMRKTTRINHNLNRLSSAIIAVSPNRTQNNAYSKIRQPKPNTPSSVDNDN